VLMKTSAATTIVQISDSRVSNDPEVILATYSLGSCIGVAAYDPVLRIGGMLHYQLPESEIDAGRARNVPAMYADTGMTLLLSQMAALGAEKRRLKIKLAGGARMLSGPDTFDIGRRNHTAVRKFLWQQGLLIQAEEIGGNAARHLYLRISDGSVQIKSMDCTRSYEGFRSCPMTS
jgi:chemotaxis protein CheD